MAINNFADGELLTAPRMNEMVGQLNTRYYTIDQTAGRVIKAWDYLNSREQIIYADTGWRDITSLVGAQYVSGSVRIKRDAQTVTLYLDLLKVSGTGVLDLPIIPTGFQSPRWFRHQMALGETVRVAVGNLRLEAAAPTDTYDGMISWPATQPWPTTLPGVADGVILNS